MNRATRDKFASGTDQKDLTTGTACWETAPLIFEKLNADFGPFDIDLTADAARTLCPRWFGPGSDWPDALKVAWSLVGTNGYSNPPYGAFVVSMLEKAKREAAEHGFSSTLLLPMRVTKAFRANVLNGAAELIFCDNRLVFFEDGLPRLNQKNWQERGRAVPDPAMFDSILVRYLPGTPTDARPRLNEWHVPYHVTSDDLERASVRLAARLTA